MKIVLPLALAVASFVAPLPGQDVPSEISELRQRVAAMRADLPHTTAVADYLGDIFTRNPASRFLFSGTRSPGLRAEFDWHTGASPQMLDADDAGSKGVLIHPVSSWQVGGLGVVMTIDRSNAAGRPVVVIGSTAGKPDVGTLKWLVNNGAADGSRTSSLINDAANLIATWVLYEEFVASATRHGWQPGIYLSHLFPNADDSNYHIPFRVGKGPTPVTPIPGGQLGAQYLDRIDSLLTLATKPAHQMLVQRAADSLRAIRASGKRIFTASCGNFLSGYLPADTAGSPFKAWNGRDDNVAAALTAKGARAGDGVLWFGHSGYDCPHVQPSQVFKNVGLKVVVVTDNLQMPLPGPAMAGIPLSWTFPERIGLVDFNPEGVGSALSVDAVVHYLWIRRLVLADPAR